VIRFDGVDACALDRTPLPAPLVLNDGFPSDASHGWKYLGIGPDDKLYVPVGAPCNVCVMEVGLGLPPPPLPRCQSLPCEPHSTPGGGVRRSVAHARGPRSLRRTMPRLRRRRAAVHPQCTPTCRVRRWRWASSTRRGAGAHRQARCGGDDGAELRRHCVRHYQPHELGRLRPRSLRHGYSQHGASAMAPVPLTLTCGDSLAACIDAVYACQHAPMDESAAAT
jgi:hypothetical protein